MRASAEPKHVVTRPKAMGSCLAWGQSHRESMNASGAPLRAYKRFQRWWRGEDASLGCSLRLVMERC